MIDYFPVHLGAKELTAQFDPTQYGYQLVCDASNVNYMESDLIADRSGDYLTGDGTTLEPALTLGSAVKQQITAAGVGLSAEFMTKIKNAENPNYGVILLDGRLAGDCNLKLRVTKNKQAVFLSSVLNLTLSGVEEMFRHKNMIRASDVKLPAPSAGTIWGMPDRVDTPSNPPNFEFDKNFVFVHGYNVNGNQARGFQAETFKRMYWSGSKAKFWAITWYGADTQEFAGLTLPATRNYHINLNP